jgi:hypothetical protein
MVTKIFNINRFLKKDVNSFKNFKYKYFQKGNDIISFQK